MILVSVAWWTDTGVWGVFIGILGIVIGAIIAVVFYFKQRIRKEITFRVLSDASVVNIDERLESKVKVLYEDGGITNEINDANLLSLRVWNSGKTPVKIWNAEDTEIENMEEPITFTFEERTVVSLTELKTDPNEGIISENNRIAYIVKPSPRPDSIGLPRCFIEPHQSIMLSILLKGPKGEVKPEGRLFGGKIIPYDEAKQKLDQRKINLFLATVSLTILLLLVALTSSWITTLSRSSINQTGSTLNPPSLKLYQTNWSNGLVGWKGGSQWSVHSHGILVSNGNDQNNKYLIAPYEPKTANYAVEAQIQFLKPRIPSADPTLFGVRLRGGKYADVDGYDFYIYKDSARIRVALDPDAQVLELKPYHLDTSWHTYLIEANNQTLTCYIDNVQVLQVIDFNHTQPGFVGLFDINSQINVRNFIVFSL